MKANTKNLRQLLKFYETYKSTFRFDKAVYRQVKGATVGNPDCDWYEFHIPIRENLNISDKHFNQLRNIINEVWRTQDFYISYLKGQLSLNLILEL